MAVIAISPAGARRQHSLLRLTWANERVRVSREYHDVPDRVHHGVSGVLALVLCYA